MNIRSLIVVLAVLLIAGCSGGYSKVGPGTVAVSKKTITVSAGTAWNRVPPGPASVRWEETWTQNGPILDAITFVGGLPAGEALIEQRKKDARQVPPFEADMTPEDLVSMIEARYRIAGVSVFEVTAVAPAVFLGKQGIRLEYSFTGGDGLPRRGRCVLAASEEKLYLMLLDAEATYYFEAASRDFDLMAGTAALR